MNLEHFEWRFAAVVIGSVNPQIMVRRLSRATQSHEPVVILLLMSDGDNDGMRSSSRQRMRAAAQRPAECGQNGGCVAALTIPDTLASRHSINGTEHSPKRGNEPCRPANPPATERHPVLMPEVGVAQGSRTRLGERIGDRIPRRRDAPGNRLPRFCSHNVRTVNDVPLQGTALKDAVEEIRLADPLARNSAPGPEAVAMGRRQCAPYTRNSGRISALQRQEIFP